MYIYGEKWHRALHTILERLALGERLKTPLATPPCDSSPQQAAGILAEFS